MRLLLLCLALSVSFQSYASTTQNIHISTSDYPPFISRELKGEGLVPQIIRGAFAKHNILVSFNFMPWKRAFVQSKLGKVDATAYWFDSPTRRKSHYYSDVLIKNTVVWFHPRSLAFDWATLSDLKPYTIVAVDGYTHTTEFWQNVRNKTLKVQLATQTQQAWKMLTAGRANILLESLDTGNYLIQQQGLEDSYTHHPQPLYFQLGYLLFSKKRKHSPYLRDKFNQGLTQLRNSGEYQALLKASREGQFTPEAKPGN